MARNNRKTRPNPRGLLADQGNGKGDKPRHTLNIEWRSNFDAINWHPVVKKPKVKL